MSTVDIPIGYPSCPGFSKVKEEDSLKKTVKVIRNGRRNPRNSGNLEIKGKKKMFQGTGVFPIVYREIK